MGKGYRWERELELWWLDLAGQTPDMQLDERTHRTTTSGAHRGEKGDVRTKIWWLPKQVLSEMKSRQRSTKKRKNWTFVVKKEWLDKNRKDAENIGFLSVVVLNYKGAKQNRLHAMIPLDHLQVILDEIRRLKEKWEPQFIPGEVIE